MIINFVPTDFSGSFDPDDCALTHSLRRAFETKNLSIGILSVGVDDKVYDVKNVKFNGKLITENGFHEVDYDLIKESVERGEFESASVEIEPW